MQLPSPDFPATSFADLINTRHSTREYAPGAITQAELANLLWAAYGIQTAGRRTVPSAGGRYPCTLHVIAGDIEGLGVGVHTWNHETNELTHRVESDIRPALMDACRGQAQVGAAPLLIAISGEVGIVTERYGERGAQFILIDVGHIGQNLMLAVEALGLGTVPMGSFHDETTDALLALGEGERTYYLFAIGRV